MQGEKRERLIELAARVAAEQDPEKFQALVAELKALLEEKEHRLREQPKGPTWPTAK